MASSGQNCAQPGKASSFPVFDKRTACPTKAGQGNVQNSDGADGIGNLPVKSGGNPTGGSGGRAC